MIRFAKKLKNAMTDQDFINDVSRNDIFASQCPTLREKAISRDVNFKVLDKCGQVDVKAVSKKYKIIIFTKMMILT